MRSATDGHSAIGFLAGYLTGGVLTVGCWTLIRQLATEDRRFAGMHWVARLGLALFVPWFFLVLLLQGYEWLL